MWSGGSRPTDPYDIYKFLTSGSILFPGESVQRSCSESSLSWLEPMRQEGGAQIWGSAAGSSWEKSRAARKVSVGPILKELGKEVQNGRILVAGISPHLC